jgi:DNA polymerase I-like protein with 3'-5' exonuclease and polymerase domains
MAVADFKALKSTDNARYKAGRQAAKAVNFGIPGGLGAKTLVTYAEAKYQVAMSLDDATRFKQKLIHELYPELNDSDGYLADTSMAALAHNLGVKEREAWEVLDRSGKRNPIAAKGVMKVVRGDSTASDRYQASVWDGLHRLCKSSQVLDPETAGQIARQEGSQRLGERLYRQSVATLTGRIRANVGYTDGKNTPFQSLAADGAKLALWKLLYHGLDVVAFVHDEILVQLPEPTAQADAKVVERLMVEAMEEVMGHGIPAACEYGVADCWKKP